MSDRPIIFSAPMVKALLAGWKTQTRRVFVPPAPSAQGDDIVVELATGSIKPRWRAGDRLWVREAWSHDGPDIETVRSRHEDALSGGVGYGPYYRAAEVAPDTLSWRPSIHMPRWASRLTLMVTEVRVERLQDISEADAVAEGIRPFRNSGCYLTPHFADGKWRPGHSAYDLFQDLWNDIHGPDAWDVNPWVAAISFTVHRANIDALGTQHCSDPAGRLALAAQEGGEPDA